MLKRSYYSVEEVAEYYGVHPDTIRKMCREGQIPGATKRIGNRWRIPAEFLEANKSIDTSGEGHDDEDQKN